MLWSPLRPHLGNDVSVTFAFVNLVHMTIQFIEKSVYVRFLVMGYVSQHEFDQEYMAVGYIIGSHFLGGCINIRTAFDIEIVADRYIGMVPQPVQPGDLRERGTQKGTY